MTKTNKFAIIDETLSGPFGELPFANFLAAQGTRWEGSPLPSGIKQGPAKQCFKNAWGLTLSHGFQYCEGFGWDTQIGPLPFHHAWCLCPSSGQVIDATWALGQNAVYLGIDVPPQKLMEIIDKSGCFGIFHGNRRADFDRVLETCNSQLTPTEQPAHHL
jgi:hypothetical protein